MHRGCIVLIQPHFSKGGGHTDKNAEVESIAKSILMLSRNLLTVNFRFLDRAISVHDYISDPDVSLATDGYHIYYGSWYIVKRYQADQSVITRDLFHVILHCVYRHNFVGPGIDRLRWDLACDIAVENILSEFQVPVLHVHSEEKQRTMIALLKEELPALTAERIYRWLKDHDFSDEELLDERMKFIADGHGFWYDSPDGDGTKEVVIDLQKLWEDISRRMQTELETINQVKNDAMVQSLRALNQPKYSYSEFLRRFGRFGEVMRLSDEEFDNNYYAYGLELYGNIPLVEPLEYSDQRRIREFVIAIDTSGSVKGDIVQAFVQHTHDILLQQENFFSRFNIRILQCDDEVREDVLVTCKEEFERYISTMEIRGLGKTDFRSVFSYVNELIRTRKFTNLQGLIYFTDGNGIYPHEKPEYETAFILFDTGLIPPEVPSWAMHINLSEDEILERRL